MTPVRRVVNSCNQQPAPPTALKCPRIDWNLFIFTLKCLWQVPVLSTEPLQAAAEDPTAGQSCAEPKAEDCQRTIWALCKGATLVSLVSRNYCSARHWKMSETLLCVSRTWRTWRRATRRFCRGHNKSWGRRWRRCRKRSSWTRWADQTRWCLEAEWNESHPCESEQALCVFTATAGDGYGPQVAAVHAVLGSVHRWWRVHAVLCRFSYFFTLSCDFFTLQHQFVCCTCCHTGDVLECVVLS